MFALPIFCITPFLLLAMLGWTTPLKIALKFFLIFILMGIGFVTGLLLTWMTEGQEYWQSIHLGSYWVTTYVDSMSSGAPFGKLMAVPYIALADMIRVFVIMNTKYGTIAMWIPEIIMAWTISNLMFAANELGKKMT